MHPSCTFLVLFYCQNAGILWVMGQECPPNAVLSIFQPDEVRDIVVELQEPKLSGDQLTYQVDILDNESRSSSLSGMKICPTNRGDDFPETELTGKLIDQATLLGVLNALYNLGYTLLSVERVVDSSIIFRPILADQNRFLRVFHKLFTWLTSQQGYHHRD